MSGLDSIAAQRRVADPRSIREIDEEIQEELNFHLEMRTHDNLRLGMTQVEARAAAAERFGDFVRIRKTCRAMLVGERIMLQRLQTGLIVILLLAVVAIGYQMFSAQRANQVALAEVSAQLARLNSTPAEAAAPSRGVAPPAWEAERPRVVETFPADGATDVDPATSEIRVTFDKEMADRNWSWVQSSPASFPKSAGDVHYLADMKTCVMPVELEPGTKYVIWFNRAQYLNFKDPEGRPAEPHLLTFTTRK